MDGRPEAYPASFFKQDYIAAQENQKKWEEIDEKYNFYVLNKSFTDSAGNHLLMDLLTYDVNENGEFDRESDYVLVGDAVTDARTGFVRWGGTIFTIDFMDIQDANGMPKSKPKFANG